ncbi:unnamed protein product [Prunus armeniaca]|uniref:Uncharacterized protein n=1 Tax=Prunus armeniaca TaxID=36596 RepID=A0A6J5UFH2_PRUAR|nr:unnamed protein product [Prunus armeniaca]
MFGRVRVVMDGAMAVLRGGFKVGSNGVVGLVDGTNVFWGRIIVGGLGGEKYFPIFISFAPFLSLSPPGNETVVEIVGISWIGMLRLEGAKVWDGIVGIAIAGANVWFSRLEGANVGH